MKYIQYKLYNGMGPTGIDGGHYPYNEWLIGYADNSININDYQVYQAIELTEQQAVDYITISMPESTTDMMGRTFYPLTPIVQADGTIRVPWSDAPLGTPDQTARLEAVETTVLDLLLGA